MQLDRLFAARYWIGFTDVAIWQFTLTGLQVTLMMAVVAIVASVILGTLLALARIARNPLLHYPAVAYIELIRALPVLYLIFFAFFGGARFGLRDPIIAATLALIAYTSAVNAEIVRAGILSIEVGQVEAARALGLSYRQTMRLIVLPQAFRRIIPFRRSARRGRRVQHLSRPSPQPDAWRGACCLALAAEGSPMQMLRVIDGDGHIFEDARAISSYL